MPLIFSFISSGPSSIVKYLRGFYCEPQNEGPESPSFSLVDSSLSPPLFLLRLVSFLCCLFQLLLSPWQNSTPIWTCFEISLLPFADSLHWYIVISTVCWHIVWVRSAEVYTAGTIFQLLHVHSDTHLNKWYHPSYIPYFISQ